MKKTGMKRNVSAAALTGACALLLSMGAVTSYGAPYDYDWNSGAEREGYSAPYLSRDSEDGTGPGIVPDMDSALDGGPSVSQSALSEQYHEEYKIYEESIEGLFFFYSSVANGGITHETVKLDLPANLTWTAEKDGQPWAYESGQSIREYGTYVFRLSGIEDESLPLSEQKEYRAVFRFRIQEKPPQETGTGEGGTGTGRSSLFPGNLSGYDPAFLYGGETAGGGQPETEGQPGAVGQPGTEGQQPETETETGAEGETENGAGTGAETGTPETEGTGEDSEAAPVSAVPGDETGNGAGGDSVGKDLETGDSASRASFTQTYDTSAKNYRVAFENGIAITSNVPGGYAGAGPVEIFLPKGSGGEVAFYRNDVPETENMMDGSTLSFGEPGSYRIESGQSSWSFTVVTATSQMDLYPAPVGMKFKEVTLDGQAVELFSEDYVLMETDGQYGMTMVGEEGEMIAVGILKDTQPPQVEVATGKGSASINYLSEDIAEILLEKSGEPVKGFRGYSITSPGDYRLTVTDQAGNSTSVSFTLKYQVNTYGIAAVVLIILVIAGIVAFVIHTKRTVKVR